MSWGRRGADTGENPLTKRDLGSTSEELVPAGFAEIPDGWLDAVCDDRGQAGADAVPILTDAAERIWAQAWIREMGGGR